MHFSTMDIVMAAIAFLGLVGTAIAISAWRHAVKIEREMDKTSGDGLPSTV